MKSNKMVDDAFLILVVKNSFFVCLPINCFVFAQIFSCIYPEAPQRSAWSYFLHYQTSQVQTSQTGLTNWSDRSYQNRFGYSYLAPPRPNFEHCSTTLFESGSSLGIILLIELSDCSSTTGFSLSSVKSEFLFNHPSFLTRYTCFITLCFFFCINQFAWWKR